MSPEDLLKDYGTTYAEQAGITLLDKPSPLYQLLVLTTLSSARISADVAATTAHVLFSRGWRTPQRMRAATWQQRVDALGEGGYARFDESTADYLDRGAAHLIDELQGDLRRLRPDAQRSVADLEQRLQDFPRIGPNGAGIFCREVQAVWPEIGPYIDDRAREAARGLGFPTSADQLAGLVEGPDVARFATALVRWSLR